MCETDLNVNINFTYKSLKDNLKKESALWSPTCFHFNIIFFQILKFWRSASESESAFHGADQYHRNDVKLTFFYANITFLIYILILILMPIPSTAWFFYSLQCFKFTPPISELLLLLFLMLWYHSRKLFFFQVPVLTGALIVLIVLTVAIISIRKYRFDFFWH